VTEIESPSPSPSDDPSDDVPAERRRGDRRTNLAIVIGCVNEVRDVRNIRQAAWRLCERIQRDRALAHALVGEGKADAAGDTHSEPSGVRELVELQNPIVDCDPNLVGRPATVLPAAEQRAFVRSWQKGELEPLPEPPGCDNKLFRPEESCAP
jgi:hypothetical protein